MELVITFLQMTLSCTSGLKMIMKINIGFHLSSDLKIWMPRRKLKLNDGKTEIIVIRGNLRNMMFLSGRASTVNPSNRGAEEKGPCVFATKLTTKVKETLP